MNQYSTQVIHKSHYHQTLEASTYISLVSIARYKLQGVIALIEDSEQLCEEIFKKLIREQK